MWSTKLKLRHNDCPVVPRCTKFKVVVLSYPSTWYEKKGDKLATTTCFIQSGEDDNKKLFLDELKKDKRITRLEIFHDRFVFEINLKKKGEHVMLYHTRNISFVKPVVNHFDGHEYWEVSAWTKQELQTFIGKLKENMDVCEIVRIGKTKSEDVYFPNMMPKLSLKQKQAINLAKENGYYSYPRKITLEELAKIAKVKLSTYHEHLRKAEMKILPGIVDN